MNLSNTHNERVGFTFIRLAFLILFRYKFIVWASIVSLMISSCKNVDLEDVSGITEPLTSPVERAENLVYLYSDSALIRARLTSPYMQKILAEEPYIEMPKGLIIKFFDLNGHENSFIKANYGIRYYEKQSSTLQGNVVVVNIDGDTLQTEELIWDERNEKVYSTKKVSVRTKDEIINSDGFESDINFTEYKFKNITGIINLNE